MTINGNSYRYEGTIHAGPRTRAHNGLVLEAIMTGPRRAYYTLNCYEDGEVRFFRRGVSGLKFARLAINPEVLP